MLNFMLNHVPIGSNNYRSRLNNNRIRWNHNDRRGCNKNWTRSYKDRGRNTYSYLLTTLRESFSDEWNKNIKEVRICF
jgi:hypothetical protein